MTQNDVPTKLSEKEAALVRLIEKAKATRFDPLPARAIARTLWPEKYAEAGTSLRRGGLCRSAGGFCSRLAHKGILGFYMDDFHRGYYVTTLGRELLAARENDSTTT